MSSDSPRYRLRARADRQRETRARIVAATAALHEEVGPARTTIADVARRAGVQRLTVYNHFPESADLIRACQRHFLASHPPPDLRPGVTRDRALERFEDALRAQYAWYRANEALEAHVHRDRHLIPELDALMRENADPSLDSAAAAYAKLLATQPARRAAVERLIRLALDFSAWRLLSERGASDAEIAELLGRAVACAG